MATTPVNQRPDLSPIAHLWRSVDLAIFALTVWRESRGEGTPGMKAVACSIRNRVLRPTWWGSTYYEVTTRRLQYSAMTLKNDPQLTTWPTRADPQFNQALWICSEVMDGRMESPVTGADSYYDDSIRPPAWATPDTYAGRVGHLIFHNVDHDVEGI